MGSMSSKAKTQIEVYNLVTEVGACNFKIQKLPQKMAIIEDNANEDMKALKFCTDSILEEIDDPSEAVKKAVDTIIGGSNHQNELDGIVEQRVTEFQKMKNKITRLKGKLIRIGNESKNGQHRCNEKMESYQSVYDGKELDQVNADVAFEEYETIIDKLKNSIAYKLKLELRETLADKSELTAIESENIKREADLKERMDQLQVLKTEYINEYNDLMEEINKMRYKVDRIVSERSFLCRREQSEELAFKAAKSGFQIQFERYNTNLERESAEGKKVQIKLKELQILLTDQRAKVDSLNNYTVKSKEYTAEIKKLNECAAKPRSNIAKLKIQLSDTKVELISVKRKSGMAEQNLSLQVTRMNLTKKNNELKWANFITTLEIKNPIYADVKIVAFENDTVYHNLKAVYALKDNIEVLEKKCTELREKSKQKQEERRLIMTETKVLLKIKGEILTNYDKRKYQLLIEKEQFVAANEVIKKQNSCCKN